jgi:hypothetical protein
MESLRETRGARSRRQHRLPAGQYARRELRQHDGYLKDAAAKLDRPPAPPSFEPAHLRAITTFREAVVIEQEVRKGEAGIRFVGACTKGHLQDIDWRYLTHRGKDQSCRKPL